MVWSEAVPPHNSNTVPPHKPSRFLPVNACWKLNTFLFCRPACERFPIDSHSLDAGLGRAPPVDFPRICSCALAVEKGSPSRCCCPETARPWEKGSKKTAVCRGFTSTTTASAMPVLRRPAGGMSKGLDGEVCEEKRKRVGDVVGPCVLVPSW